MRRFGCSTSAFYLDAMRALRSSSMATASTGLSVFSSFYFFGWSTVLNSGGYYVCLCDV